MQVSSDSIFLTNKSYKTFKHIQSYKQTSYGVCYLVTLIITYTELNSRFPSCLQNAVSIQSQYMFLPASCEDMQREICAILANRITVLSNSLAQHSSGQEKRIMGLSISQITSSSLQIDRTFIQYKKRKTTQKTCKKKKKIQQSLFECHALMLGVVRDHIMVSKLSLKLYLSTCSYHPQNARLLRFLCSTGSGFGLTRVQDFFFKFIYS